MRTILENLSAKTLDELEDLGFRLLLEPPEGRRTKAAWAALEEQAIRNAPVEKLRQIMLPDEWQLLSEAAQPDPQEADGWSISAGELRRDPHMGEAFDRLVCFGLAYRTRQQGMILPQGVTLAQCDSEQTEEDVALVRMTDGLLRRAGCAPLEAMGHMLVMDDGSKTEKERQVPAWMLERMAQLWQLRAGMAGISLVDGKEVWLVAEQCPNPVPVLRSQLFGKGKELKYPSMSPWEAARMSVRRNPVP